MKGNQSLYEAHNVGRRGDGFSILKDERGALFAAEIGTGKKVLDLGCRDGALTRRFAEGNDVTGADIDTVALAKAAAAGIKTVHLDIHGDWSELGDETYDAVVLAETLEHLYHPAEVVAKIRQVSREGALLVGSVPNAFSLKNRLRLLFGKKRGTPLEDPTHINHFRRDELSALLAREYEDVRIVPLGRYAQWDWLWPGMFAFDLAFVCRRPRR
jgi:2-polyprenyl-3-methyl-5-hydroxy-6-metoxy-1,4-benzoquinol methylase